MPNGWTPAAVIGVIGLAMQLITILYVIGVWKGRRDRVEKEIARDLDDIRSSLRDLRQRAEAAALDYSREIRWLREKMNVMQLRQYLIAQKVGIDMSQGPWHSLHSIPSDDGDSK